MTPAAPQRRRALAVRGEERPAEARRLLERAAPVDLEAVVRLALPLSFPDAAVLRILEFHEDMGTFFNWDAGPGALDLEGIRAAAAEAASLDVDSCVGSTH